MLNWTVWNRTGLIFKVCTYARNPYNNVVTVFFFNPSMNNN